MKELHMNLEKLAPWNWFKKEEERKGQIVPVRRSAEGLEHPASLLDLHREFDRLFDSLQRGFGVGFPEWPERADTLLKSGWFKPSLDVASDEKAYIVKIELPGINANDVSIEISGNTLHVKGEKRQETEETEKNFYRIERSYGSFERILDLPEDADADNITSTYKDGVLSINLPKKALPKPDTKKIEITAG